LNRLGAEKFGYLSIVWVVFGVFGLLDLGLGRALTINVARLSALGKTEDTRTFIETALSFILVFGIFFSIIVCLLMLIGAGHWGQNYFNTNMEYLPANLLVAASLWTLLHGAVLRGALEGFSDFKNSSLVRVFLGVSVFIFPSIIVSFNRDLIWIFASIVAGRLVSNVVLALILSKHISFGHLKFDKSIVLELLKTGAWITVSNTLGPLIVYSDRFMISHVLTISAVTYFSLPADAISRILILPISLATASFPFLSANRNKKKQIKKMLQFSTLGCLSLLLPCGLILFFFSETLLSIWVSPIFAEKTLQVAKLLVVGYCINGLGQIPFSALQALGFAKVAALWHFFQLIPYILLLFYLTQKFGVVGSAGAALIRCTFDTLGMWLLLKWQLKAIPVEGLGTQE
jgi:O-antigen/teichoic acid export membrane protein